MKKDWNNQCEKCKWFGVRRYMHGSPNVCQNCCYYLDVQNNYEPIEPKEEPTKPSLPGKWELNYSSCSADIWDKINSIIDYLAYLDKRIEEK